MSGDLYSNFLMHIICGASPLKHTIRPKQSPGNWVVIENPSGARIVLYSAWPFRNKISGHTQESASFTDLDPRCS